MTATESASTPAVSPIPLTGSLGGERAALRSRRAGSTRGTKRSRKVYRITDQGRRLFEELLAADEPVGTDEARSFSLRLAFARHLAPQARLALLERRREQLARRLVGGPGPGRRPATSTATPARWSSTAPRRPSTSSSWLDRLIETEKQKQAAPAADQIGPRTVGSAATPGKGSEP